MSAFDGLSPALRYQIVNDLGWDELRPVQEQAIEAILEGDNCVVLAPTAGGKTEAAFFPLLSLMDVEDRPATSTLYIAPIRALLNNQEARLQRLTALVGRTAFKWHGDVGSPARKRFVRDPADVLAITPESIEAMLMSTTTPGKEILSRVQTIVIDEVHAFAADDRGSHLVALIERITRLSGRDIQRIGLSATVGDPDAICRWLAGSSGRAQRVVDPGGKGREPQLSLDFVGGMDNAARLVDELQPGTRRLVFVDSRRRVEELGDYLERRGANVFVTHSSLAASERHAAEQAFEEGDNCIIVATSALELGIDVGDLDHVLQVDAPSRVASFLQRMGRTGRRPGATPNCTFLATTEDAVLQSAALLRLHAQGYVEPTEPSHRAPHILAHQLLALGLQQVGVAAADWYSWLEGCAAFEELTPAEREEVVDHMLAEEILVEADARLVLGPLGERLYGRRHFQELFAVFSVPPILRVMHGNQEVGSIDAWFAQQRKEKDGPLCFVLGKRSWQVESVNWKSGTCQVKPAEAGAYPRWMGSPVLLSRALCQAMREVLVDDAEDAAWSKRTRRVVEQLREEYSFLHVSECPLVSEEGQVRWWTFAGGRANALLAGLLEEELGRRVTANNLRVVFSDSAARSDSAIRNAIHGLAEPGAINWERASTLAASGPSSRLSKFEPCLPAEFVRDLQVRQLLDVEGARTTAVRFASASC